MSAQTRAAVGGASRALGATSGCFRRVCGTSGWRGACAEHAAPGVARSRAASLSCARGSAPARRSVGRASRACARRWSVVGAHAPLGRRLGPMGLPLATPHARLSRAARAPPPDARAPLARRSRVVVAPLWRRCRRWGTTSGAARCAARAPLVRRLADAWAPRSCRLGAARAPLRRGAAEASQGAPLWVAAHALPLGHRSVAMPGAPLGSAQRARRARVRDEFRARWPSSPSGRAAAACSSWACRLGGGGSEAGPGSGVAGGSAGHLEASQQDVTLSPEHYFAALSCRAHMCVRIHPSREEYTLPKYAKCTYASLHVCTCACLRACTCAYI